mgnify:CR=1 FL=1
MRNQHATQPTPNWEGSDVSHADQPIAGFLDDLAAGSVTPGGGGGAALGGATGAALGEMVCANTLGGDVDDEVASALESTRDDLADARGRLLDLIDEDAEAVETMMDAYRDGEEAAIQDSLQGATVAPLAIAEASRDVLEGVAVATELGNPNAVPDGFIGAHLARGAMAAAVYTVRINLPHVEDEAFVSATAAQAEEIERAGDEAFERARANAAEAT